MTPKPGECCLEPRQLDMLARGEQVRATVGRDDGRGQVDSADHHCPSEIGCAGRLNGLRN